MFSQIGILGLGLIGGSLAKALKKYKYPATIYGYNRNQDVLQEALEEGVIDIAVHDFSTFSSCDLVILCCPVQVNLRLFEKLLPYLKEDVVISDVGSTKSDIYQSIKTYDYPGYFIGGHPMAGSEQSGFSATKSELFENAYYVLTPQEGSPKTLVDDMCIMAETILAFPTVLEPQKHDYAVAAISHVPHILASALVNLVENIDFDSKDMYTLAAGGFKDFTRIASSSPQMWQEICLTNPQILDVLDLYIKLLEDTKTMIKGHESDAIYNFFSKAQHYRDTFQKHARGSINESLAIFINIKNEPGVLARISTILWKAGINIKNIGINYNREDFDGVLEVDFYTKDMYQQGKQYLENEGYDLITKH